MADFVQTMKDWRRMCEYYASNCDRCPLCNFECGVVLRKMKYHTDDQVEAIILEWVKVHPEPVYPTWEEWLDENGVIGHEPGPRYEEDYKIVPFFKTKIHEPIPADIAQKLGIDPKAGGNT